MISREPDNVLITYALKQLLGDELTVSQLTDIMAIGEDEAKTLLAMAGRTPIYPFTTTQPALAA